MPLTPERQPIINCITTLDNNDTALCVETIKRKAPYVNKTIIQLHI